MKARELIEGGSYDPDQIKIMADALEAVWARIAPNVRPMPEPVEAARLKIARIILALAAEGVLTPHELAEAAYQRMFADPTAL